MKKNASSRSNNKSAPSNSTVKILPGLILLSYILIPTYTPNLMAFDTNAPKFLAMSLVNIIAYLILLTDKHSGFPLYARYYLKNWVGLVYIGFIVFSFLSLVNAINLSESIVQLVKVLTVFVAVLNISVILMRDLNYVRWVIILFAGMLIFDSLSVFYNISEFIQGRLNNIDDILTIYSNKNILASALFVKLPFALWLLMYGSKWLRVYGWIGLTMGAAAVFFMATRAFYLGLLTLSFMILIYLLVEYSRKKQKSLLQTGGYYIVAISIAYGVFSFTQSNLYPKKESRYTQSVTEQLGTINLADSSTNVRLQSWKWSLDLLKEKPLFGVGSGNWKVSVLKYENRTNINYQYLYKAHNDFLETAAETGIIGGLLYACILAMVAWAFLIKVIKKHTEGDHFQFLFLSVTGAAFYSVDAMFNFPADRPEIQVLFSFFIAIAIAVMYKDQTITANDPKIVHEKNSKNILGMVLNSLAILIMLSMSYVFLLNFQSSKTQRIVYEEIKSGTLRSSSDKIIAGLPAIPNLNILGEPINVIKARYLLFENKNEEAITLLHSDNASPWDGRKEYFLAMGFTQMGIEDSAIFYSERMYELKPNHSKNILILSQQLERRNENEKVEGYLEKYLATNKANSQAFVFASGYYERKGDVDKAWEIIEEAKTVLPSDTLIEQQHRYLYEKKFTEKYKQLLVDARRELENKNYSKGMGLVNEYIANVPGDFYAHQVKSYLYYYLEDYRNCINEIDTALSINGTNPGSMINLRGVCYYNLGDLDLACRDFEEAMRRGEANGGENYERFCRNRPK